MSRRDTLDSMTAGETILLTAVNAVGATPVVGNLPTLQAMLKVKKWVVEHICQPQHTDMVAATSYIGELAEHAAGKERDANARDLYIAVYQAAYDFSQTLDHNLSMEAPSLPF